MFKTKDIIDYANTKDIAPFDEVPFNEVDSLILSQLCYSEFSELKLPIALSDLDNIDYLSHKESSFKKHVKLMHAVKNSPRFKSILILDYINTIDTTKEKQFSATTFDLGNNHYYIAYSGTDSSLVGWKESFNLSYLKTIPSQIDAKYYYEKIVRKYPGTYRLGGHSKGGNLAVFAGVFADKKYADNILKIYNHDGPGFPLDIIETKEYTHNKHKISKSVAEASIVGLILEETEDYSVIKSRSISLLQHDPFNWIVEGKAFKRVEDVTKFASYAQQTLIEWISDLDNETKKICLDSLFMFIESTGVSEFQELKKTNPRHLNKPTPPDKKSKRSWKLAISKLFKSFLKTGQALIFSTIER